VTTRNRRDTDLHELATAGYRYAFALTHDRPAAEDLLQDAWEAMLRAGGHQRRPYLFCAIRTRFLNHCQRAKRLTLVDLDAPQTEELADERTADELFIADWGSLGTALGELQPLERELLFLWAIEGYTAQEIGELTNRARGTVLSLLHRTKLKLRERLETVYREIRS